MNEKANNYVIVCCVRMLKRILNPFKVNILNAKIKFRFVIYDNTRKSWSVCFEINKKLTDLIFIDFYK